MSRSECAVNSVVFVSSCLQRWQLTGVCYQLLGFGILTQGLYIVPPLIAVQTELVQERLKRHVQHLLKFGRDTYDKLQYDAVTADINQPLMINAGECCVEANQRACTAPAENRLRGHLTFCLLLLAAAC